MDLKLHHAKIWIYIVWGICFYFPQSVYAVFYIQDLSIGLGANYQQTENSLNHFQGLNVNADIESTSVWFDQWPVILGFRWQKSTNSPTITSSLSSTDPTLPLFTSQYDYLSPHLGLVLINNLRYQIGPLISMGFPIRTSMLSENDYPESKVSLNTFFKQFWVAVGLRASIFLFDMALDTNTANKPLKIGIDGELWLPLAFAGNTQVQVIVSVRFCYVF